MLTSINSIISPHLISYRFGLRGAPEITETTAPSTYTFCWSVRFRLASSSWGPRGKARVLEPLFFPCALTSKMRPGNLHLTPDLHLNSSLEYRICCMTRPFACPKGIWNLTCPNLDSWLLLSRLSVAQT